ncbi:MAG: TrmB family transcriptional regulator [Candidatus Heimdallarchaeaceae archaeon]
MSASEDIDSKLKELGLTQYEIKTLKTLLARSTATAEEIHKQTDIPTPRIYDTVDALEKKGLVKIVAGRPKKFEPVNLELGLQKFLEFKEKEFTSKLQKMNNLSQEILSLLSNPDYQSQLIIKPDELLESFSSLSEMQLKTIDLINKAKKEICIFTNVFYWFIQVQEHLLNALKRGVKVRVLMTIEDEKSRRFAENLSLMGAEVRSITGNTVLARGTLIDQEQVVFVIWVSPIQHEKYVYRPHISSNPGIIEIFSNNFEFLWERGETFS